MACNDGQNAILGLCFCHLLYSTPSLMVLIQRYMLMLMCASDYCKGIA